MAKDDSTDVLMLFKGGEAGDLQTDCQTDITEKNPLLTGFKSADGNVPANFFEIDDIDIGVDLRATNKPDEAKSWGLDLGDVSVDRTIDRASPLLMQALVGATPYKSAVIVKRRAGGGERSGRAYLRIDYDDVLITKISWSDSELVKEKITFIYRSVRVRYRQQDMTGKLITGDSTGMYVPVGLKPQWPAR